MGFPDSSVSKESTCNARDSSLIPVRKICWRRHRLPSPVFLGFPCGSAGKESAFYSGDLGSLPGLGRSHGEGKSYPLQYSGLENSIEWGRNESDTTEQLLLYIKIHVLYHACSLQIFFPNLQFAFSFSKLCKMKNRSF